MPSNNSILDRFGIAGKGSFEFYAVLTVIGILLVLGFQRYSHLMQDVGKHHFYLIADRFSSGVAAGHAKWFLDTQMPETRHRSPLTYSSNGWPTGLLKMDSALGRQPINNEQFASEKACEELLHYFVPDLATATFEQKLEFKNKLHITLKSRHICRYQMLDKSGHSMWFDYDITTGATTSNRSTLKNDLIPKATINSGS